MNLKSMVIFSILPSFSFCLTDTTTIWQHLYRMEIEEAKNELQISREHYFDAEDIFQFTFIDILLNELERNPNIQNNIYYKHMLYLDYVKDFYKSKQLISELESMEHISDQ